ncbi:hypothetical protein FF38_02690 [Lucilia cuprina]|uniref:SANT and BTB domain-containing protein n=1 Tax=Lucilia cuprina TaxID=7375 RepID=A0A0L0CDA3_LUCCU|nr:hypothetical protein FF38_02690 [Lucilia cuprina]
MSSRKNSLKNNSELLSNSTTVNTNPNASADSITDKSINLNEFLDFLNLSCHVNDMISNNSEEHQRQHKEHFQTTKSSNSATASTTARTKSYGTQNSIDFHKLSQNRLVNDLYGFNRHVRLPAEEIGENNVAAVGVEVTRPLRRASTLTTTSKVSSKNAEGGLHPKLNEKLDYVLNEGILDAVLPFICPVPLPSNYTSRLKPKQQKEAKDIKNATGQLSVTPGDETNDAEAAVSKDSTTKIKAKTNVTQVKSSIVANATKKDPEVVIHVCDEVKNTSKDFVCPQSLLVSKMGYFADVTAGQKLEDMDISVHCDIQIFEWLMKWVKSENANSNTSSVDPNNDMAPNLNVNNVVPILVSASFLQMEPLLMDCLSFCHSRLGEVVRVSTNLSCLNDTIITRMAAMFTNVELEMVCDKKDRLLPRLWTKLILSLFEPETEALRGHYYSLSGLFKCSKCQKCLTNTMKSYIQCIPGNVRLNRWGQIVSHHVREPSWDLNYYITQLFKEVKSWRLVYWKLWGHAHYLYCCLCEMYFPVYQMSWCRYHPESPSFLGPVAEGRTTGPAGRYACCGQQAFRYETLPGPHGCQFREHSVLVETDRERSILTIVQLAIEGKALGDCPPHRMQDILANAEIEPRWMGISLMPQRCRQGLLPVLNPDESTSRVARRVRPASSKFFADSSTETESTDTLDNIRISKFGMASYNDSFSTSSSDGCESSDSKTFAPNKSYHKKQNRKSKPLENPGRYWSGELSARSNQDHQREFEEKVMKQVMIMVQKKTGSDLGVSQQNRPLGGTYVKLEQEWKEQLKQRMYALGGNTSTSTQMGNINSNNIALNIKGSRKKVDNSGQ